MDQFHIKLNEQAALYPTTSSISFDQMDLALKDFVNSQRNYLLTRNDRQLVKFKDYIEENRLFEVVTAYYTTMDQVSIL